MSIIFNVASATRKEDTYIVMAAGSDPESNEEPVATGDANSYQQPVPTLTSTNSHQHHNHYHHNHSHHHHHYLGLPYQDHNYGAPPPPTPPQSPPLPKVNGFIEESCNISNHSATETADENEENSITRCICGFDHDDGYMICCDKCSVWQHVECMGIDKGNIPEIYFCDECEPRLVDKDKAVTLQSKKKEKMTDTSATDSSDEVTTTTYTAVSNSPTSLTLTTLKSKKLKKKRRRKEKGDEQNQDNFERKTKNKHENNGQTKLKEFTFVDVSEDTMDSWDHGASSQTENYVEADKNQYSADIQHLLTSHDQNSPGMLTLSSNELPAKLAIASPINATRKGLYVVEMVKAKEPIIEYKGKVVLKEHFDAQDPFFKRPYPYVLFYNIGNVGICVDARTYGADARFVRRSCKPNAEVKHAVIDGNIHLYLCAIHDIPKATELTIGFDYNYKECGYPVECACLQTNCPVAEHTNKCFKDSSSEKSSSNNPHKNNHIHHSEEDLSSSTDAAGSAKCKNRKVSPLRVSISNESNQTSKKSQDSVESSQTDGQQQENEASKEQKMPEPEGEQEELDHDKLKKMTREERKMHAIMEAFKKLERTQKRRQQALERIANAKAAKAEQSAMEGVKEETQETEQNGHVEEPQPVSQPQKPRSKCRNSRKRSAKRRRVNSTASSNAEPSSPEVSVPATPITSVAITSLSDNSNSGLASPTSSNKTFRFPKTKKFLINEWLNDKAQEASASKPLTIKTEAVDLQLPVTTATSCPATPVLRTAVTNSLDKSLDGGSGADARMGSAKKRWLRQAMSETTTTPTTNKAGSVEYLSPVCNGTLSPTANSPLISPNGSSVNDFMTPLKKRRLRASISEETVTTVTVTMTASAPPLASTPPPPLVSSSQVDSTLRTPSPQSKVPLEESSRNGYKPLLSPITPITPVTQICKYEPISSPDTTPEVGKYQSPFPFPPSIKKDLSKQISADSGFSGTPTDCKLSPISVSVGHGRSFDSVDCSKTEILTETSESGGRNCKNVNSHVEVDTVYDNVVSQQSSVVESHVSTSTDHLLKHFQSEPIVLDSSKRDTVTTVESALNVCDVNRTAAAARKESEPSLPTDIRTSMSVPHVQNLKTGSHLSSPSDETDSQKCVQNNVDESTKCSIDGSQIKAEEKLLQSNSPRSNWHSFDQNKMSPRTKEHRYIDVQSNSYRSRRNSGPADNRTHYGVRPSHNPFADDNVKYESGLYTSFTSPRKLFLPVSSARNSFNTGPSKGQTTKAKTSLLEIPTISSTTEAAAPKPDMNKTDVHDSDVLVTNSGIDSKQHCVSSVLTVVSTSSPLINSQCPSVASSTTSEEKPILSSSLSSSSSSSSSSTSPPPVVSSTTVTTAAASVSASLPSTSAPSSSSGSASTSTPTTPVKRKVSLLEYRKRMTSRKEKTQTQPPSSTTSSPSSGPTTPTTSSKSVESIATKSTPKPIPTLAPLPLFNPASPLEENVNGKSSVVLPIKKMKSPMKSPLISSLLTKPKEKREELEAQWKTERSKDDMEKLRRDLDNTNRERERRNSGGIRTKDEHSQSPLKRPASPLPPPPPPSKVKKANLSLKLQMPPPPPPRNGPERLHGDIVTESVVSSNSKQQALRTTHYQQPPPPPPQPAQKDMSTQQQPPYQQPYQQQQQSYQYPQQYPQLQSQQPPPQQQQQQQQYPQQQQQYNYNGFGQGYGDQKLQPPTQQHFQPQQTQQYQQQAVYQQQYTQQSQYQHQQPPQRPPQPQQPAATPPQHPYQQPQQQQQQQYPGYGQQHYNSYSRSNGFYQQ